MGIWRADYAGYDGSLRAVLVMNILVVANHYAVCSARYLCAALERIGHKVRHVGPNMGRNIWGLALPPGVVWRSEGSASEWQWEDWKADLRIICDSDPAILDALDTIDVPTVVYGIDNHVRHYARPYMDAYFLAHYDGPIQPVSRLNEYWSPCAYDPVLHTASSIPFPERSYDVALLGVLYPHRRALVDELKKAGFRVLAGTGLVDESYVRAYQDSKISLCLSAAGDVALRVFETTAIGCVVMSEPCADYDRLQPRGIWLFDKRELVSDIRQILANPAQTEEQIAIAQAWVREHTWDARANQIVEWSQMGVHG